MVCSDDFSRHSNRPILYRNPKSERIPIYSGSIQNHGPVHRDEYSTTANPLQIEHSRASPDYSECSLTHNKNAFRFESYDHYI